jgi:hypothetical protein
VEPLQGHQHNRSDTWYMQHIPHTTYTIHGEHANCRRSSYIMLSTADAKMLYTLCSTEAS